MMRYRKRWDDAGMGEMGATVYSTVVSRSVTKPQSTASQIVSIKRGFSALSPSSAPSSGGDVSAPVPAATGPSVWESIAQTAAQIGSSFAQIYAQKEAAKASQTLAKSEALKAETAAKMEALRQQQLQIQQQTELEQERLRLQQQALQQRALQQQQLLQQQQEAQLPAKYQSKEVSSRKYKVKKEEKPGILGFTQNQVLVGGGILAAVLLLPRLLRRA